MLSNTCQKCHKPMNGGVYKAAHQCPNCFHEHDRAHKKRRARVKTQAPSESTIPLEVALDGVLETALTSYTSSSETTIAAAKEPTNKRNNTPPDMQPEQQFSQQPEQQSEQETKQQHEQHEQQPEVQAGVSADSLELVIPETAPKETKKIEHALKKEEVAIAENVKNDADKVIPEDSDSTLLFSDVLSTPTTSSNRPEFSLAAITQRLDNSSQEQKATHETPQEKELIEPAPAKSVINKETDEASTQQEPQNKHTTPLEVVSTAQRLTTKTEVAMPASQEKTQDNTEGNTSPSNNSTQESHLYKKVILTTEKLHNLAVTARLEVISADYIFGMNIVKDLFSEGKFVGGRSHSTQTALKQARIAVLDELRKDSYAIGANAVVGVDVKQKIEMAGGGNAMLFISATGTAVKAKAG